MEKVVLNTNLTPKTTANDDQALIAPEHSAEIPSAITSTDLVSTTDATAGQASNTPKSTEEASLTPSSTDMVVTKSVDTAKAPHSPGEIDTARRDLPPIPHIPINSALSTTLTISSWLRLLPVTTDRYGNTSSTIQKWLKDTLNIHATSDDITKITESSKAENISPLQTAASRCMALAARKDLGNTLMTPCGPAGAGMTSRASLRGVSGNIEAAVRKASGRVRREDVMAKSGFDGNL